LTVRGFRVRLETLSPIHVGSGERLSGLDYAVLGDVVYVVDSDRLFNAFMERGLLERYLRFVSAGGGRKMLSDFLKNVGLFNEGFLRSVSAYTMRCSRGLGFAGGEVKAFVRGPDGSLYLPGSSLKGSLRTAVILSYLLADTALQSRVVSELGGRPSGVVVENVLRRVRGDLGSDLLRLLRPSDLFLLSSSVVGEVAGLRSLSFRTGRFRVLGFVEVVPSGVVFEGVVRVLDEGRVVKYVGGGVDLDRFVDALRVRSDRLLDRLLKRFGGASSGSGVDAVRDYLEKIRDRVDGGGVVSTVGFGQGYWGVTVTEFKPELLPFLRLKSARGLRPNDFPRSLRVVDRGFGLEPLGWVLLRFEEVGG
jgi:CRISPR type III-A-associated RAMP protein Csm5